MRKVFLTAMAFTVASFMCQPNLLADSQLRGGVSK